MTVSKVTKERVSHGRGAPLGTCDLSNHLCPDLEVGPSDLVQDLQCPVEVPVPHSVRRHEGQMGGLATFATPPAARGCASPIPTFDSPSERPRSESVSRCFAHLRIPLGSLALVGRLLSNARPRAGTWRRPCPVTKIADFPLAPGCQPTRSRTDPDGPRRSPAGSRFPSQPCVLSGKSA